MTGDSRFQISNIKFPMTFTLPVVLAASAAFFLLGGLAMLLAPAATQRALAAFPRNRAAAWILAALDIAWVVLIMRGASLGRFDILKPYLPLAGVATFAAVAWGIGELLAVRALGGFLLLLGDPILDGVRWAGGFWPLAAAVLAYVLVITGAVWMLWPWTFRKTLERLGKTPLRWRLWSALWIALGFALAAGAVLTF
jgi:hypothetical protein